MKKNLKIANHAPITPNFTKHFITQKQSKITHHAKIELLNKHRGEIYVYIYKACSKCLKHIKKNSMKLKHTLMD